MKKNLFVMLMAIVMLFPTEGLFAKEQSSSLKGSIVGRVPEGEHINAFRIDKIVGSKVINIEGQDVGSIDDLVIDIDTGGIVYAVLEFGGFVGLGDKLFAVPWQTLTAVPAEGIFIIDQSKAKLEKAPGFDKNNWPDLGDRSWGAGIYEFYRHHLPAHRVSGTPRTAQEHQRHLGYRPYPGYETELYPYSSVWQNLYGDLFDPQKIETVTGEIVKVEYYENLRLVIYTDAKKPVLVALGPIGYFEGQPKDLKVGNKVTVTGSRIILDDTPFLIATKIREGKEELRLRDNQGHPLWIGWQKIK
jgi:sporulation protein YlmC with PRC-barrel domain